MKFLLQTQIGIEKIAYLELLNSYKKFFSKDFIGFVPHKNGIVQINWRGDPCIFNYQKLGTIEDAFWVLQYCKNISYKLNLQTLPKIFDIKLIEDNLFYFMSKLNNFNNDKIFRLVVRKKSPHLFRRIDLENKMYEFLNKSKNFKFIKQEGLKEIWITLIKNRLIIAVRLTDSKTRHREYKKQGIPGSLRPTVAYSMLYVTNFSSNDVIWDPFCGAGTILCEAIDNFKFKKFIASDINSNAIEITRENVLNARFFKKYRSKISIKINDFFESNDYANVIVSNLPFNSKHVHDDDFICKFNQKINLIKNLRKVTILYPEKLSLKGWQLIRKFKIKVLGKDCYIQTHRKIV